MKTEAIKAIQARVGVEPDGFFGPKSVEAVKAHLRAMMPNPHPFPRQDQASLTAFYGPPGVKDGYTPPMAKVVPPFQVFYGARPVPHLMVHAKLAESLARVFAWLHKAFPTTDALLQAGLMEYAGMYNPRPMRGGTLPSLHARAAAIDLDPGRNDNKAHWPDASNMPLEVMECFAAEGWLPAGAFWGRDAMHFQATQ